MSDDDVTVKKIEKELFKILDGSYSGGELAARVEAAKILLIRLDDREPAAAY